MKSIAFVILKSPYEVDSTGLIKTLAKYEKRSVILLEDGVYWAVVEEKLKNLLDTCAKIYAASDDLKARGFDEFSDSVNAVDYERIVEVLMEECDQIITL